MNAISAGATTDAASGELACNSICLTHIVFFVVAAAAPLTAVVGPHRPPCCAQDT
jgi:hypothetical protein